MNAPDGKPPRFVLYSFSEDDDPTAAGTGDSLDRATKKANNLAARLQRHRPLPLAPRLKGAKNESRPNPEGPFQIDAQRRESRRGPGGGHGRMLIIGAVSGLLGFAAYIFTVDSLTGGQKWSALMNSLGLPGNPETEVDGSPGSDNAGSSVAYLNPSEADPLPTATKERESEKASEVAKSQDSSELPAEPVKPWAPPPAQENSAPAVDVQPQTAQAQPQDSAIAEAQLSQEQPPQQDSAAAEVSTAPEQPSPPPPEQEAAAVAEAEPPENPEPSASEKPADEPAVSAEDPEQSQEQNEEIVATEILPEKNSDDATSSPQLAAAEPAVPAVLPAAKDTQVALAPFKPAAPVPQYKQGDGIRDCADCPVLIVVSIEQDFAIGRNEVTFDEWDKCVAAGACTTKPDDMGWGRGSRPVISVSFDDVTKQYLPWLSGLTGKTYRLPTDAEWELAARGGARTDGTVAFATSRPLGVCANFRGPSAGDCPQGLGTTAPAGAFGTNRLGLADMYGNVWEWVDDCWQAMIASVPAPSNECPSRVLRGGSWSTDASLFNPTVKGWDRWDGRKTSIGFRVARSLQ